MNGAGVGPAGPAVAAGRVGAGTGGVVGSAWPEVLEDWGELVTTALLGTERRPLPPALVAAWRTLLPGPSEGDRSARDGSDGAGPGDVAPAEMEPAVVVLGVAAARHTAVLAGRRLGVCPPPPQAPAVRLLRAPDRAQRLLAALLASPETGLVNAWLGICAARGLGVAEEHWTRLAGLAARSSGYDRGLLHAAVGPRGRWFFAQNPSWARLADEGTAAGDGAPARDPEEVLAAARRGDPPARVLTLVLACADPWPEPVVRVALALLASGLLGAETRSAGQRLGYRVPLDAVTDEELAVPAPSAGSGLSFAVRRAVELGFGQLARTVQARRAILDAFDPDAFDIDASDLDAAGADQPGTVGDADPGEIT